MDVICGRTASCGFRVHDRYFHDKPRFSRSSCPRCGGPLVIVEHGTDKVVLTHHVDELSGEVRAL